MSFLWAPKRSGGHRWFCFNRSRCVGSGNGGRYPALSPCGGQPPSAWRVWCTSNSRVAFRGQILIVCMCEHSGGDATAAAGGNKSTRGSFLSASAKMEAGQLMLGREVMHKSPDWGGRGGSGEQVSKGSASFWWRRSRREREMT